MIYIFKFKNEIYEKKSYKNDCRSKCESMVDIAKHVEKRQAQIVFHRNSYVSEAVNNRKSCFAF